MKIGAKHAAALLCLALAMVAPQGSAYRPILQTWPDGQTSLQIGDLNAPWNAAFIEAAARWHDTAADITINLQQGVTSRSCDLDDQNGVWWADEECDGPWDDLTLAITYYWYYQSGELVEADMIFNPNISFNIYDGAETFQPDFRRTSIHELGHVFGMDHSNIQNSVLTAIIGDIYLPRQDDVDALVYSGGYGLDPNYSLNIEVQGSGTVTVNPRVPGTLWSGNGSLICGSSCQQAVQKGLRLDAFAQANAGETFLGWQGISGCTSLPGCQLSPMNGGRTITAVFSGDGDTPDPVEQTPARPSGVQASDKTLKNKIRISWNAVDDSNYYELRRKPQGGSYQAIAEATSTQYVDRTVDPMRQYVYQVRACNDAGCSSWSNKDGGKAKFKKVTGVSATDGKFGNRVTITWKKDGRADAYEVRRSKRKSGGYSTVGTPTSAKLIDYSAVQGTIYYYKVRSCNDYGCGKNSAVDSGFAKE